MRLGMGMGVGPQVVPPPPWSILGLGPYLWYRADQGTVAGSHGIATWQDQSGNGRDEAAGSSSAEPVLNATIINGYPGLLGDGVNTLMTRSAFTGVAEAGSVDVFIVMKLAHDPPVTGFGGAWQIGSPAAAEDYIDLAGDIYCGIFSTARKNAIVNLGAGFLTTPRIFEVHSANGAWSLWADGVQKYSTATNTIANGVGQFALFGDPEAAGVRMDGAIGEVLIFAPSLDDTNRGLVRAELATRWGLSL